MFTDDNISMLQKHMLPSFNFQFSSRFLIWGGLMIWFVCSGQLPTPPPTPKWINKWIKITYTQNGYIQNSLIVLFTIAIWLFRYYSHFDQNMLEYNIIMKFIVKHTHTRTHPTIYREREICVIEIERCKGVSFNRISYNQWLRFVCLVCHYLEVQSDIIDDNAIILLL